MSKPRSALRSHCYRLRDGTELPLTLRRSSRSRTIRLRISAQQGLVVSAHTRTSQRDIEAFLRQQQAWLARHWSALEPQYRLYQTERLLLPDSILLPGLGELWRVEREDGAGPLAVHEQPGADAGRLPAGVSTGSGGEDLAPTGVLTLQGRAADESQAARTLLQGWLQRRAKRYLPVWLARLAERHGFRYSAVSVRNQRGRWGSCSARGGISLNCKLLLLPAEQASHVMLHELCHTIHLNHSPQFWQLLKRVDPATEQLQLVLDAAWQALPGWCR